MSNDKCFSVESNVTARPNAHTSRGIRHDVAERNEPPRVQVRMKQYHRI